MNKENLVFDKWTKLFLVTIFFSMAFAASLYILQFYVIHTFPNDPHGFIFNGFRASRMLIGYVIPSYIFVKAYHGSWKDLGFKGAAALSVSNEQKVTIANKFIFWSIAILGGICVYAVAAYIFVKYHIFYDGWNNDSLKLELFNFSLIAIMAGITDLWTRGFILLQLNRKYGPLIAIISQNVIWFGIHVYEIDLLTPYITVAEAIALTLFLGITGDIIALRTHNIVGLMLGHALLNFAILLGAYGYLSV